LFSRLTLAVVAEGHLGLAEANGVFALGDAIELLKFGLVDALHGKSQQASSRGQAAVEMPAATRVVVFTCLAGEIELDGLDANVGGTGSHSCDFGCGEARQGKGSAGREGRSPLV
jgi:hypothetical protein